MACRAASCATAVQDADLVQEANQARDRAQNRPESGTETPVGLAIMLARVVGWLGPPSRRCPLPLKPGRRRARSAEARSRRWDALPCHQASGSPGANPIALARSSRSCRTGRLITRHVQAAWAARPRPGRCAGAPCAEVWTPAFPGRKQACTHGSPALVPVVQSERELRTGLAPASVGKEQPAMFAPLAPGDCSDSSDSAASAHAERCASTVPSPRSRRLPCAPGGVSLPL
jgi:hypothetical protein